ncbi:regulatory protein RecX [Salinactinospora qingdaonensis]|uniref:Regulatory protein RecX n=1 Tax=Salinactinospora qingdaonensis TaxID=702744 RepID=A0ABP7G751_9ACTN
MHGQEGQDPLPGAAPPEDDPAAKARGICLRLLATTPRTRAQLAEALADHDIPDEIAGEVLGRFSEVGLIDDVAFAHAWVDSRHTGRGLAGRALAAELRRRGVAEDTVREAVDAGLTPDREEDTARALVRRKLTTTRHKDVAVRARRAMGVLARKGYAPGLAYRLVREELEAEGTEVDLPEPDFDADPPEAGTS